MTNKLKWMVRFLNHWLFWEGGIWAVIIYYGIFGLIAGIVVDA